MPDGVASGRLNPGGGGATGIGTDGTTAFGQFTTDAGPSQGEFRTTLLFGGGGGTEFSA